MKTLESFYFPFTRNESYETHGNKCVLCPRECLQDDSSTLGKKGCEGLLKAAEKRGDTLVVQPGQRVHKLCRRDYCEPSRILAASINESSQTTSAAQNTPKSLRSKQTFAFKTHCFFCKVLTSCEPDRRNARVVPCQVIHFKATLLKKCVERGDE
jgi:hypothetical protein